MDTQTAPARNIDVVHGAGAGEEHQEKSPMFKKMKDKVKKIKKTITKKVHVQGGHQEQGDLDEGDEGYDDDEEMVEPEVHGAPIYDSSAPRAREATTQNRPNAVGEPGDSSDPYDRVGIAQNRPNALGGSDERSDARAMETAPNWPNAVGGPDESSDARARVETAEDRPNAVEGPDESFGARARVGTTWDLPIGVGGPDESTEARPRVGTAYDRPNAVEGSNKSSDGHEGDGAVGLGLISGEDPAPPKTSPTEAATAKEQNNAGEEFEVPPELSRSFEAMAVSNKAQDQPEDRPEDKLSKDKNSTYTEKISSAKDAAVSAASLVYGKVAVAGTAVMAKVKPEAVKDGGEHENVGKSQDKSVSMKDYLVQKLTPGEDDKALSAQITDAVHKKKDAAPVTTPREAPGAGEAGGGLGVVGKMRETVTSFLGGGGSSPKSAPATEPPAEVAEDTEGLHSGPTEAVSHGKDAAPVTTPREVTGSGETGGGVGVVGKMRETVTSFLGGGGSSPKSAPATESPAEVAEDTGGLHSRPTEAVSHGKDAASVTTPREVTGSGEAGGGKGVVGKMRETVTSFLGGGGTSPKSAPGNESPAEVSEDTEGFHNRQTEAVSHGEDDITEAVQKKKDAAPVTTPPREVTGSGEAGGGMGVVGKIRETVTSFLGGGGSSPKSASANESPTKEDTKDLHSRPTEKDLE